MSPRPYAQGISWRLIGPAIGLWLLAVIALSALASPATATQATPERPASNVARTQAAERGGVAEAPALTLVLAGLGIGAGTIAARPARRAVARRRIR